jgi:hypothetical protein
MPENFIFIKLTEQEWIMADRGFNGLAYLKILSYQDFKDTELDSLFLSIRSVVENSIAMIKKWRVCDAQFRKNLSDIGSVLDFHHKTWVICGALCNMYNLKLR